MCCRQKALCHKEQPLWSLSPPSPVVPASPPPSSPRVSRDRPPPPSWESAVYNHRYGLISSQLQLFPLSFVLQTCFTLYEVFYTQRTFGNSRDELQDNINRSLKGFSYLIYLLNYHKSLWRTEDRLALEFSR